MLPFPNLHAYQPLKDDPEVSPSEGTEEQAKLQGKILAQKPLGMGNMLVLSLSEYLRTLYSLGIYYVKHYHVDMSSVDGP